MCIECLLRICDLSKGVIDFGNIVYFDYFLILVLFGVKIIFVLKVFYFFFDNKEVVKKIVFFLNDMFLFLLIVWCRVDFWIGLGF